MALQDIPISSDECIGDSLDVINDAFLQLDSRTITANSNINIITTNIATLSANFTSKITTLSAILSSTFRQFAYDTTNTFYVNSAQVPQSWRGSINVSVGNDSTANGSSTKPFATLKGCLEYIYNKIDCNGGNPSVRLCAGVYVGTWISGMPVGSSRITTTEAGIFENPPNRQFEILGNSNTTTFITQVKNQDAFSGNHNQHFWSHLRIENGVYLFLEEIGFRYSTVVNPVVITTTPGGTTPVTTYNVLKVSDHSVVTVKDCVYESILMVLTNSNPQQASTTYNYLDGFCRINFDNIIINNTDGRGTSNARYFLWSARSACYFYNSIILQNNPRFNIFAEPSQASHLVFFSGVSWSGDFGSQSLIVEGTPDAFDQDFNYTPTGAKNYIVKADGPHCWGLNITEPTPGTNSFLNGYSIAQNAALFNVGFPQDV